MKSLITLSGSVALIAALALTAGCAKPTATSPKGDAKANKADKGEHGDHGAGPHGGAIGDWGGGKYHIEFTVSHPKKEARVYILGKDEKTPTPIVAKDGQLALKIKGVKTKEAFDVVLKAEPQTGDPAGKASCFVGTHEQLGVEQEFEGTVSGEANGTPYTGDFKEEPAKPDASSPKK